MLSPFVSVTFKSSLPLPSPSKPSIGPAFALTFKGELPLPVLCLFFNPRILSGLIIVQPGTVSPAELVFSLVGAMETAATPLLFVADVGDVSVALELCFSSSMALALASVSALWLAEDMAAVETLQPPRLRVVWGLLSA